MILKTIPQSLVLKLRENFEDPLIAKYKEEEEYISKLKCPRCGSKVIKKINGRNPFNENGLLPNLLMECKVCNIEFDPYTQIESYAL